MTAGHAAIVRYLRDCFVADHRTGGVTGLFAARIEHRHFFTGDEELIGGEVQPVGVPRAVFEPIARAAALYRRERVLLYCAFPLVGSGAPPVEGGAAAPALCAAGHLPGPAGRGRRLPRRVARTVDRPPRRPPRPRRARGGVRRRRGGGLVGHPGAFADALDLERCRMLLRAGLPIFPLPLSAWRRDWERAIYYIRRRLARGPAGGGADAEDGPRGW